MGRVMPTKRELVTFVELPNDWTWLQGDGYYKTWPRHFGADMQVLTPAGQVVEMTRRDVRRAISTASWHSQLAERSDVWLEYSYEYEWAAM